MNISLEEFINYNQSSIDQIDPLFRESIFTQYQGSPQLENIESRSNSFSQRLQEKLNLKPVSLSNSTISIPETTKKVKEPDKKDTHQVTNNKSVTSLKIPTIKYRKTSDFGLRQSPTKGASSNHKGVDYATPKGTHLKSPFDGKVVKASSDAKSGNYIVIENNEGKRIILAHCDKTLYKSGDNISKGDVIAHSGNSGTSTGAHVHIGQKENGQYVNPNENLVAEILS